MQHAQERVSSLLAEVERLVREDTLPAPAKREVLTAVRAAREATNAAATRESARPWQEFTTPSGSVQFTRRILWFYPAPIGWARMQRLHTTGSSAEYRRALAAALGQVIAAHPELHAALFRTLLSHIAFSRTIDGIESLYLTLLHSAAFHGQDALYKVGLSAWTAYGPPRATGGDLGFTLFYNVATTTFTILSPHQLAGLGAKNGGGGILSRGAELGSGIAALGAGWRTGSGDDETANEARITCRDALVNAGAIVGLAASGSAGAVSVNADRDVTNEPVGAVIMGAPEAGLSIGILLGGDGSDGFAAALCGGSVDVEPHREQQPAEPVAERQVWSSAAEQAVADFEAQAEPQAEHHEHSEQHHEHHEHDHEHGEHNEHHEHEHHEHEHHEHHDHHEHHEHSWEEHEVAVSVVAEPAVAEDVVDEPIEAAAEEQEEEEESDESEPSAVAGEALGLISNFFATGPGTDAFLTRVAPTSFYLAGAPMVYGREPGAVALGFLGANPHVARSFERLVGSALRRR
jgi:hypothetical protein